MEQHSNDGAFRAGEPPYFDSTNRRAADGLSEATQVAEPVGRARRLTGLILLVLGGILVARMGWLYALYMPAFGEANGLRVAVLSWIGLVFALTGYWLRYRSPIAGWAAIVSVPFFFGGLYLAVWLGL